MLSGAAQPHDNVAVEDGPAPSAGRIAELLELARQRETPDSEVCVRLAKELWNAGNPDEAYGWLARTADGEGTYKAWAAAATALSRFEATGTPATPRTARIAVAGSYTTSQFSGLFRVAALRRGVYTRLHNAGFDSYAQEILNPASPLYEFEPDYVILAPHQGAIHFPSLSQDVEETLEREVERWTGLWDAVSKNSQARIVQHNVVIRPDTSWGHVSARVPGSRDEMLRSFNARLARAADDRVLLIDCDRIASMFGKHRWFDDRYWHIAKQAVALDAIPDLARHTAAVLAAAEGLSAKCVVLDLDNTLWGGVIGEDGLAGIRLGDGPEGEAYIAFQEYLLELRDRGVLLAVVSKNNERDAREPFERHPDMRLRLSDVAVFVANWRDKATNVKSVADQLNIGLDSLVFVDDNPAEREVLRQSLPEVEVISMPAEPALYVRALSESLLFEAAAITREDLSRAEQYRAREAAASLRKQAGSLEDFYKSLDMEAFVAPFDELNLARIVQLIGKTNQFNVTTRRHSLQAVRSFMEDSRWVTLYLRLRDHFVDHGLVAVLVAEQQAGGIMDIDTWLMSCRVIGRTVEDELFRHLCRIAVDRRCTVVRGTFIPSAKNGVVEDLFPRLGFERDAVDDSGSVWTYDLAARGLPESRHIRRSSARWTGAGEDASAPAPDAPA